MSAKWEPSPEWAASSKGWDTGKKQQDKRVSPHHSLFSIPLGSSDVSVLLLLQGTVPLLTLLY